ncbi:FUSC family protein [Dyella acidiphila]|uniref:FUSC family protein n=1 Tax=Dyella acidiphila TaxID=2775866 RepID=A0ABR9G8D8_9GAMM|nr:FUSC family protein [Dyella acidiphila]MBE1160310.1 FUSC family protein [Dyella acidiphila]
MSESRPIRESARQLSHGQQQLVQIYRRMPWGHRLLKGVSMGLQALAGASMGYGLGLLLHTQQAFWAALTAISVTQQTYLDTRNSSRDQVIGAAIGAAVAIGATYLLGDSYLCYAGTMVLVIMLCWCFNIGNAGKLSATTATIVMLVPHEGPFWTVALTRLGEVTLGIACALVVTGVAQWLEQRWLEREPGTHDDPP